MVDKHEGLELNQIDYRMEIICFSRTAFERQIKESVLIENRRDHHLLNSKAEFNRSAVPRLGLKFGDKEFREMKEQEREEQEKEETLEMKIREIRKRRQEARKTEHLIGQPAKKRRKKETNTDEQTGTPNRYNNIHKTPGKKRKIDGESPNSPAKAPRMKKSGPLDRFLIPTVTNKLEVNLQETEPETTPNQPKTQFKSGSPEPILTKSAEASPNTPRVTPSTIQNICKTTPTSVKNLLPTNPETTPKLSQVQLKSGKSESIINRSAEAPPNTPTSIQPLLPALTPVQKLQSTEPETTPKDAQSDHDVGNPQSTMPSNPPNRKPDLPTEPQPKPKNLWPIFQGGKTTGGKYLQVHRHKLTQKIVKFDNHDKKLNTRTEKNRKNQTKEIPKNIVKSRIKNFKTAQSDKPQEMTKNKTSVQKMVEKLEDEERQEVVRRQKEEEKETAKDFKKTDTTKPPTTPRNQLTRSVILKRTRNLVRTPPTRKTNYTFTSPRTNPKLIEIMKEDIFPKLLYEKTKQNLNGPQFLEAKLATGKCEPPIGDQGPEMCDQPRAGLWETRKHE